MKDNADTKFVRGFFKFIAWLCVTGPVVYAIWTHDWVMLVLLVLMAVGTILSTAIKAADD